MLMAFWNALSSAQDSTNWPAFRGEGSRGVADGFPLPTQWHVDPSGEQSTGVLWQVSVPGQSHSSPVVFGDKLFLLTCVASTETVPVQLNLQGAPTAAIDNDEQSWVLLCYNKTDGSELWRKTARKGIPRATRHAKATHANTSVSVDGEHIVAFLGSEGLYCFDLSGELLWERDLGTINISKYGIGWGYASSPAIFQDRIALLCDDPANPFVTVLRLSDGEEVWRASRKDLTERNWSTPLIHANSSATQLVVNGWPWIISYELETGQELWRIRGGGDNPVPTPFESNGRLYITNAHGGESPIFAIRPDARGELTESNDSIVWSTQRGGCYISTPVVYQDYLYLGNTNGAVRCFHAVTGEKVYEKRLETGAAISASLVAGDGKIYCPSEDGFVYVLSAGPEFEILAANQIGSPCLASPAISEGTLFIRSLDRLIAIK